jgi:hypothetical protein
LPFYLPRNVLVTAIYAIIVPPKTAPAQDWPTSLPMLITCFSVQFLKLWKLLPDPGMSTS